MNYNRQKLREKMIDLIMQSVISDASGEGKHVVDIRPSQIFFVGNLSTKPRLGELQKVATKLSPNSIGIEILLPLDVPEGSTLTISPSGAFYYRVFPDYKSQKSYSDRLSSKKRKSVDFIERFKKRTFSKSFSIDVQDTIRKCETDTEVNFPFNDFCSDIWNEIKQEKDLFSPISIGNKPPSINIPIDVMKTEADFESFINGRKQELDCNWGFEINIKCFKTVSGYRMVILFVNNKDYIEDQKIKKSIENYIFESKINIKSVVPLKAFILDQLEKNYKHDRTVEAAGINCSFTKLSTHEIETNHVPIFRQPRRVARNMGGIKFKDLNERPIQVLNSLKASMKSSYNIFSQKFAMRAKTHEEKEEFEKDMNLIKNEIERFENGIEHINKYKDSFRAFQLMNQTFEMSVKEKYDSWYPFQIVFITSLVPDVIAERHPEAKNFRNHADLLYFPTGGGKTEAFLGLAIFQAFYDRISGKKFGVSVITKFPLRMLSLDQMRRIAEIFAKAETIRKSEPDIGKEEYHPFSVGYFVGAKVTPNKLIEWDYTQGPRGGYKNILEDLESDKEKLSKFQLISKCPFCESNVDMVADKARIRLAHVCINKNCVGELPIYITDTEIFRYVPTFIVGTLDKMASIGQQINFRNILGAISHECELHGFSSSIVCTEDKSGCKSELKPVPKYDYSPSLLIQDEMHLVRETLGSFDSHYETAIAHLISVFSDKNKRIKIVCATATLSDKTYNDHVNHLYLRDAIKFPAALEIFTDESNDTARMIVGLMPHSKTLINSMEEIIISMSNTVQTWVNDTSTLKSLLSEDYPDETIQKELRDFWTILTYHIKKNDAYQLSRSVSTRINETLQNELQLKTLRRKTLTGDVNFKEIKQVMNKVKEEKNYENALDLIIATSIISHGVDIDALNLMTFMGMPGNNAEYIQALSRVGRQRTGLVFAVFNPTREKDRSYFKHFEKFHQLSDLLIEPTPIQRWSKKVVEKTCPGIFCGAIYSYFDFIVNSAQKLIKPNKLNFPRNFKEVLRSGVIKDEEIIEFIKKCYTDGTVNSPPDFIEKVKSTASECVNSIIRLDISTIPPHHIIGTFLSPQPLQNLRDVEEGVFVALTEKSISILRKGIIKETDFTEED